jgi:peptidyl-prolyl cis-trans isomerase B (cyclophilin B)
MIKKTLLFLFLFACSLSVFAQKYRDILSTEFGNIEMILYDKTPQHRDNFVKLCKKHFYDGTLFHRVIPGFMIQGGDPDSKNAKPTAMLGNGDVGYRVPAEINAAYFHKRGALAAARDNNPEKASSGCQFYIVDGKQFTDAQLDEIAKKTGRTFTPDQRKVYKSIGGAPHLDGNYTVFGEVIKGMDIIDKIANQKRDKLDRPDKDQKILKLRIKRKFLFFWL